jgi:hypothetical protein
MVSDRFESPDGVIAGLAPAMTPSGDAESRVGAKRLLAMIAIARNLL